MGLGKGRLIFGGGARGAYIWICVNVRNLMDLDGGLYRRGIIFCGLWYQILRIKTQVVPYTLTYRYKKICGLFVCPKHSYSV